ncbi:MAG: hypothetical protein J1F71_02385 [Clostridiales bacterium]|nr:hypothetical protein [Clostridiales bacterium]
MKKEKRLKRKTLLYVPTMHFIIYAVSLGVGILASVLVVLLGYFYENSVINYFLSFTASLVITPIFAYFIDVANSRIQKTVLQEKRETLLYPLAGTVAAAFGRTIIICNYDEFRDKEITYNNLEECIDILLDKYVIAINKLSYQRNDFELINECFNYFKWEELGFREVEKQLKIFLDNQVALLSEGIMAFIEIFFINRLYDAIMQVRLPYLSMVYDIKTRSSTVDWPMVNLSETDINNLHSAFSNYFFVLNEIIANIPEFNFIKDLQIKTLNR